MKRPTASIEEVLAHSGSEDDSRLVGEYLSALEANAARLAFSIRNANKEGKPFRTIQQNFALRAYKAFCASGDDGADVDQPEALLPFPTVIEGAVGKNKFVGSERIRRGLSTHTKLPIV